MTCFWYCDFEAYRFARFQYIVKEVSILKSDGTECYTYMVKSPKNYMWTPFNNKTMQYQYNRHKLKWEDGYYTFNEAMEDIRVKVEDRLVYAKGLEKVNFLERELWMVRDLDMIPSFKKLNNCSNQWCELRHGSKCARRKVHEMKHYVDTNDIKLCTI